MTGSEVDWSSCSPSSGVVWCVNLFVGELGQGVGADNLSPRLPFGRVVRSDPDVAGIVEWKTRKTLNRKN